MGKGKSKDLLEMSVVSECFGWRRMEAWAIWALSGLGERDRRGGDETGLGERGGKTCRRCRCGRVTDTGRYLHRAWVPAWRC